MLDGDFHYVGGVDGADDARPVEGALAVLYAGRLEVRNDCEILPNLAFKAVLGEFLTEDCVRFAYGFQTVSGDGAGAADSEAGAGEGLAEDHVVGKAECFADHADFVFEEDADGLYQFELHVFGQAACVVVRLDAGF